MRSQLATFGCAIGLIATLTACETPRLGAGHHVIGSTLKPSQLPSIDCRPPKDPHQVHPDKEICGQAEANKQALSWYRENEWPYHRTDVSKPPQVCLAFSGGGIRSAAFSIGVMKGLSEITLPSGQTLLDQVDILSGASGGAYAASWYYMQHLADPQRTDKELFDEKGTSQSELLSHADFLNIRRYASSAVYDVVLMSPFNFILNGVLGTHTNTNQPGNWIYQDALRTTFYSNKTATLGDLQGLLTQQQGHLPYLIITTTSRVDENNFHYDALLRNTVFEFTPLRIGNDGFTYITPRHENYQDLDIARIVSISGAALESSQMITGSSQRFLASIANADYGQYLYNYNDTRHERRRIFTKLVPFPFYFLTESYNHDLRGSDIYLSDGGHQENLAAYPLIRRQCQNILIVDGEYDPQYEFESYFKLRSNVQRELRVTMSLQPTHFCNAHRTDENCTDNNVDAIQTVLEKTAESGTTRGEAEALRFNASRCCFTPKHPVIEGKIGYVPLVQDGQNVVDWQETKLLYVKLSLDKEQFEGWETHSDRQQKEIRNRVGTKAAEYYAAARLDKCAIQYWNACEFPQYSTTHQSFTPEQFAAYIDLGAAMVKNHVTFTGGKLHVTDPPPNQNSTQ